MVKRTSLTALVVVWSALFLAGCNRKPPAQTEQSLVPAAGGTITPVPCTVSLSANYVNDSAEAIDSNGQDKLEQKLLDLKNKASIDFSVVTVRTTGEQPIAEKSLALARCWKVGETNPDKAGMLLMLAVDDRKWHLQISRSVEKILSNEEIQEAGRVMTPYLRQGDYSQGVNEFVDTTINTLSKRRGFSKEGKQ